jgi:hypothetical protein
MLFTWTKYSQKESITVFGFLNHQNTNENHIVSHHLIKPSWQKYRCVKMDMATTVAVLALALWGDAKQTDLFNVCPISQGSNSKDNYFCQVWLMSAKAF